MFVVLRRVSAGGHAFVAYFSRMTSDSEFMMASEASREKPSCSSRWTMRYVSKLALERRLQRVVGSRRMLGVVCGRASSRGLPVSVEERLGRASRVRVQTHSLSVGAGMSRASMADAAAVALLVRRCWRGIATGRARLALSY